MRTPGGIDGGVMILAALFRSDPVQPNLLRLIRGIARGGNFDLVRTSGELDGTPHVVQSVDGGEGIILSGLLDVAVHGAFGRASFADLLAIDGQDTARAEDLQIQPVISGF